MGRVPVVEMVLPELTTFDLSIANIYFF